MKKLLLILLLIAAMCCSCNSESKVSAETCPNCYHQLNTNGGKPAEPIPQSVTGLLVYRIGSDDIYRYIVYDDLTMTVEHGSRGLFPNSGALIDYKTGEYIPEYVAKYPIYEETVFYSIDDQVTITLSENEYNDLSALADKIISQPKYQLYTDSYEMVFNCNGVDYRCNKAYPTDEMKALFEYYCSISPIEFKFLW